MRVLPGPTKSNTVLAWSPNGQFVAAGGSGVGVTLWDVEAETPGQHVLGAGHGGEEMVFCPVTGRLYVAFRSGGFWTVDPDTGAERGRWTLDNGVYYDNPAVSADGRTVVLYRYSSRSTAPNEHAIIGYEVSDTGALTETWMWPDPFYRNTGRRFDFTWRPRTNQLFGIHDPVKQQEFAWVTATTGAQIGSLELPAGTHVAHWTLSPDGDRVAWLAEHTLYVQRLDGAVPLVLPAGPDVYRRGLAWSPDGRTLAHASGRMVCLLDADTLSAVRAFDWGTGKPRAVAFSPDGFRAAVSADGGRGWVTVFDLE